MKSVNESPFTSSFRLVSSRIFLATIDIKSIITGKSKKNQVQKRLLSEVVVKM
jgi:hypothetical protein